MRKYQFTNKLMFAIVMHDPIARRGLIEKLFPDKKVKAIYFPGKNGEQEVADAKEVLKYGYRNPTGKTLSCKITFYASSLKIIIQRLLFCLTEI